ncbi:MAG: YkgJ family cysteine cluster protein [Fibrobacterota bacterium]
MSKKNLCRKCGECCRHIAAELDPPDTALGYKKISEVLSLPEISVFLDHEDSWCILINKECSLLKGDNSCADYEGRPKICRKYSAENCTYTISKGDDEEYQALFETPEEFAVWFKVARPAALRNLHLEKEIYLCPEKFFSVDINEPSSRRTKEEIFWFLIHGDTAVYRGKDGVWYLIAGDTEAFTESREFRDNCDELFRTADDFTGLLSAASAAD